MTSSSQPSSRAACSASSAIRSTSSLVATPSGARASNHRSTVDAITLVPPGLGTSRPTVARDPSTVDAARRAARTTSAAGSIGSARCSSGVVPAWLPCPVNRNRHRPCARIEVARPTGAARSTRPRPCSTCSSTKQPIRPIASGSAPSPAGSTPAARTASARLTPSASRSARAASAVIAPVSSREPRHGTPNRPPSSSANTTTASGRRGVNPLARSRSTATSADTTPSGPSNAPPPGTESRWLPVTTASGPGAPHHAHRLPLRSGRTSRPRAPASAVNHSRSSSSVRSNPCRE